MADTVNTGHSANDGSGDQLRVAFAAINAKLQAIQEGLQGSSAVDVSARALELTLQSPAGASRVRTAGGTTVQAALDAIPGEVYARVLQDVSGTVVAEADRAEAARDAAFVNAAVYPSTAAAQADSGLAVNAQYQVVSADGLTIERFRKDSSSASTLLVTYPSARAVDAADANLVQLLSGAVFTLLESDTPPSIVRGVYTLGNVSTVASVYGWRSPFKSNGVPFNVVQLTVSAAVAGTMRVAIFDSTKRILAWGDCEVGTALSTVTVLLNKTVRSLTAGATGYIGYFDPALTRLSSYPGAGAYDPADADPTAYPEQYVTTGGLWVNGVAPGSYKIGFRAFDLVSSPRSVGEELTMAQRNAADGKAFQRFAAEDVTVVSSGPVSVVLSATAPSAGARDITYCAWGQVFTPAAVSFNAIRIPLIAQIVTTESTRWKELAVFVRVGSTPLSSGTVVARGTVRINASQASQAGVVVVLKDPVTGLPKTLTDAELGSAYMVAVQAKNADGGRAACGDPRGTLSNSAGISGYLLTSSLSDVESAAFGSTGGAQLAFEHLLITDPVESTDYVLKPEFQALLGGDLGASALVVPPTLYALQGQEAGLYFDNLILDDAARHDWKLSTAVSSGTMRQYDERFQWVPAGAVTTGSLALDVVGKSSGATLASASINLRAAAAGAGSGLNKKVILVGDSLVNAAVIGQTLLDLAGPDAMDVTLYGTRGTGLNKHEGRPGWRITQYTTDYTDAYGSNPFWISSAINVPQYLANNSVPAPDWFCIALGINDCFGQTTDAGVVALAASSFTALDGLIASAKAAGAGVKVALMIPSPPSASQDSFALSEAMTQTRVRFKRNILIWARELIARYAGQEASRIYLVSSNLALDTRNNMSRAASAPVNARSLVNSTRQNNGVHPAVEGYQQIGDALWAFLKVNA